MLACMLAPPGSGPLVEVNPLSDLHWLSIHDNMTCEDEGTRNYDSCHPHQLIETDPPRGEVRNAVPIIP